MRRMLHLIVFSAPFASALQAAAGKTFVGAKIKSWAGRNHRGFTTSMP
jgi:hypothetical protein